MGAARVTRLASPGVVVPSWDVVLQRVADVMETQRVPLRDALVTAGVTEWGPTRAVLIVVFGSHAVQQAPNACIACDDVDDVVMVLRWHVKMCRARPPWS